MTDIRIRRTAGIPSRFALLGRKYTEGIKVLINKELRLRLDSVEAEGRGIVSNPRIGVFIWNIMKGSQVSQVERNLDLLAAAKDPAGNAFLKELLEFNLFLGEGCIRQKIEPVSCTAYIDPGKILKSMVITRRDYSFLFNLRQRVSYSQQDSVARVSYCQHLLVSVAEVTASIFSRDDIEVYGVILKHLNSMPEKDRRYINLRNRLENALKLMDEKKQAKEEEEKDKLAKKLELEAARAERRKLSRKRAKASRSEEIDPKKVPGIERVEFNGLSGPLLEKWQRVETEGRRLLLLRGENLGHRIRRVLKGEEADELISVITRIGDETFDPFLRAFLEFHLALCRKLYQGNRLFYNEPAPGYPHPTDPQTIFAATRLGKKDKNYLVSLYEQCWQVRPVLEQVLYIIRHTFSANDPDIYGFLQKELEAAVASKNLNLTNVLRITLTLMKETKKEEDREATEIETLQEWDEMLRAEILKGPGVT